MLTQKQLIKEQIRKSYEEILFIKFIFSFVNCLALIFLLFVLHSIFKNKPNDSELYIKFLEASSALFTPYLTMLVQGFLYPKSKSINALRYILFKEKLDEEDKKMIYGK